MVDQNELFAIADSIAAEGQIPSLRNIRERLRGSFTDIGPLLIQWRVLRNYRPRPHRDHLPAHLRDKLATIAAEIWFDGLRTGGIVGQNERDELTVERDALRTELTELLAVADALKDRLGLLEGNGDQDRSQKIEDPEAVETPPETPRSYWDRLMAEVLELLGAGELSAKDIVEKLSKETVQEAARRDGAWGWIRLAEKMRRRSNLFEQTDTNVFRRRGGGGRKAA